MNSGDNDYRDMEDFEEETNIFWDNYSRALKAERMDQNNNDLIVQKLKAAIAVFNEEIEHLYRLSQLKISPLARSFIEDASRSCNTKSQLYQAYLKAMENPDYNYRIFLRPLIINAQIANNKIHAEKYLVFSEFG